MGSVDKHLASSACSYCTRLIRHIHNQQRSIDATGSFHNKSSSLCHSSGLKASEADEQVEISRLIDMVSTDLLSDSDSTD